MKQRLTSIMCRPEEISAGFLILLNLVLQIIPLRHPAQNTLPTEYLYYRNISSPGSEIHEELEYPNRTQVTFVVNSATREFKLTRGKNSKKYRILLHMESCMFTNDDYLEIMYPNGTGITNWKCAFWNSTELQPPLEVMDDLSSVTIIPRFKNTFLYNSNAHMVANLYQDLDHYTGNDCPRDWVACNVNEYKNNCSKTCENRASEITNIICAHGKCRCIPSQLTCNAYINCGRFQFEEDGHLCDPMKTCSCGTLGVSAIVVICSAWLVLIAVSIGAYRCVRNSATILATIDIVGTLGLLILWNVAITFLTAHDSRISMVFGTIFLLFHLILASWLYIGNRQAQHLSTSFTFSLMYLAANVLLLVFSLPGLIIYFGFTAHLYSHEDARLWVSGIACGFRLFCVFSALHFIKNIHKRLTRT